MTTDVRAVHDDRNVFFFIRPWLVDFDVVKAVKLSRANKEASIFPHNLNISLQVLGPARSSWSLQILIHKTDFKPFLDAKTLPWNLYTKMVHLIDFQNL
jgi:hypothetical protein